MINIIFTKDSDKAKHYKMKFIWSPKTVLRHWKLESNQNILFLKYIFSLLKILVSLFIFLLTDTFMHVLVCDAHLETILISKTNK